MIIINVLYLVYRVFVHALLFLFLRKKRAAPAPFFPGISVLLAIKGIPEGLEKNLSALLTQHYDGELELIIAVKNPDDPAVAETKRIVKNVESAATVKWVVGDQGEGLNPKNSNLVRAFAVATQPWIYVSDADTCVAPGHLRELVALTENNPTKFATGHSVYHGGEDLGALLEGVGTNFEATGFFLISNLFFRGRVANGAALFYHRDLLTRVGGMSACLNTITDDFRLANLFLGAGATGYLAPQFVTVQLKRETWDYFVGRYTRWMLIARTFQPGLFWLAPFYWLGLWNLGFGLACHRVDWIWWSVALFASRVIDCFILQTQIGAREDRGRCWVMIIYDLIIPFLWTRAIFKRTTMWNGQELIVQRDGQLARKERQ